VLEEIVLRDRLRRPGVDVVDEDATAELDVLGQIREIGRASCRERV